MVIEGDLEIDTDGELGGTGFADGLLSIIGMGRVPFTIWLAFLLMLFAGPDPR